MNHLHSIHSCILCATQALTAIEGPKERTANWHTNLPKPPADFPDGVDFTLTCDEAEYLEDRIQQCLPESLLAAMIKMRVTHTDIPYPWLHPIAPELPSQLTEILWHAHHFSEIMHGAALLYNLMLAESHKQFGKWKDHYQQAINHWWIDTQDIRHKISNTALIELWNACNSSTRHRITPGAKTFVTTWYNIVHTARNIESFTHKTSSARSLIFNREKKLKGVRARIGNAKLLAEWRGSSGAAQLNYRWKVSSRIIEDIVSAL